MDGLDYEFTTKWFDSVARGVWDNLIPQVNPTRILEVGSYEGASTCYLVEKLGSLNNIEVHCVDTWLGGLEHQQDGIAPADMVSVEQRFHRNVSIAKARAKNSVSLFVHKRSSANGLAGLISEGKSNYFDFIYIDGSHQAPDVLCDAVLGFQLLRENGVMAFDDYLWYEPLPGGVDPIRCPKVAIDAFVNIYCRKIRVLRAPLYQLYIQKIGS